MSRAKFSILDAIKLGKDNVYMLFLTDKQGKQVKGKFYLQNFSIKSHYSFIDLYIKNCLNIVPIIAVDFSLANLTFDDKNPCLHTLKEGAPNDYIDCMKSVSKSFHYFSRFTLPVGFGGRYLTNGSGPATNLFAMTGDFEDPFVDNINQLTDCYTGTIKNVQLTGPIIYKEVFKFVCDLAMHELKESGDIH